MASISAQSLQYDKYLKEVTKAYLSQGRAYSVQEEKNLQERMFGTKYKLRNIRMSVLHQMLKDGFSFSGLDSMSQARIWTYIFKNTDQMCVGLLAVNYFKQFQNKKSHPLIQYWPLLRTWIPQIENWAHGDMISGLYCDMLTESPDEVYPTLLKWSQAASPWKNRMAILSMLYYFNPRRNVLPFRDVLVIVEPHIEKDHHYLQKAVGWCLREMAKVYPVQTEKFVDKNILLLTPTAFTTALENIKGPRKERLKKLRKINRSSRTQLPGG